MSQFISQHCREWSCNAWFPPSLRSLSKRYRASFKTRREETTWGSKTGPAGFWDMFSLPGVYGLDLLLGDLQGLIIMWFLVIGCVTVGWRIRSRVLKSPGRHCPIRWLNNSFYNGEEGLTLVYLLERCRRHLLDDGKQNLSSWINILWSDFICPCLKEGAQKVKSIPWCTGKLWLLGTDMCSQLDMLFSYWIWTVSPSINIRQS